MSAVLPVHRVNDIMLSQLTPVTSYISSADWLAEALGALLDLAGLQQNWDGYSSPPIGGGAVQQARRIILELAKRGTVEPRIRPVSGGGLQLDWSIRGKDLDVAIFPAGETEYLITLENQRFVEGSVEKPADVASLVWFLSAG